MSVGQPDGIQVTCECGWSGWIHNYPYKGDPGRVIAARECPACERIIEVVAEVRMRDDPNPAYLTPAEYHEWDNTMPTESGHSSH